jgi:mannose/fructose-specific phosphotransferase system component IIA
MIRAVIVTHGNLGAVLVETAESVFGGFAGVSAVTNTHKSPQVLSDEIRAELAKGGPDDRFVVFADFFGGSCCHACLGVEQERDDVRLITGINLPMLLAFLYKREEVPFEVLPDELAQRGQNSIRVVGAESL